MFATWSSDWKKEELEHSVVDIQSLGKGRKCLSPIEDVHPDGSLVDSCFEALVKLVRRTTAYRLGAVEGSDVQ